MMPLAVDRPFECTPHAIRSVAMAFALTLNFAILLFAIRPMTPFAIHAPPPQTILAALLQPPRPTPPPPTVPTVHVVEHVAVPSVHVALAHAAPVVLPVLPSMLPVAIEATAAATSAAGSISPTGAGNSDATIAYATATPPAYPVNAVRAGIQGTVLLKVLVDPNGEPLQVVIAHSSGSHLLDEAARKHVLAAWRFHPAMRDGHAIKAWALVPVRFNLDRD
ncbi:MAG: energy transducer TonB [Rhodanobacteraceae bacterium]